MFTNSITTGAEILSPMIAVLVIIAIVKEFSQFGDKMSSRQKGFNFLSVVILILFVTKWEIIVPGFYNWIRVIIAGIGTLMCFGDLFYIPTEQRKRVELNILQFLLLFSLLIGSIVPLLNI